MYCRVVAQTLILLSALFMSCEQKTTFVQVETPEGNMIIELYNDTPAHRDNFIQLVNEGFYDDLLFHRVMKGFMIQGGDPESQDALPGQRLGKGGLDYLIDNEIQNSLYHKKGALVAARKPTQVNPELKSSACQFYIVDGKTLNDNEISFWKSRLGTDFEDSRWEDYRTIGGAPELDNQYTVFGEVVSGMDVIDKIAAGKVDQFKRPYEDIAMKISVVKWKREIE